MPVSSSKTKSAIQSSPTSLHFYALPRAAVIRIFSFLPLNSLLTCQRISKRFRTLITRSPEIRPNLFLEPPLPSDTNTPTALHPVFARLNFFAYHSAKAIRIGEGLDGTYLMKSAVRKQFATSPALRDIAIRVISGGEWPFDAEISISNEKGVTVWDIAHDVTRFFNEYEQISFGDHFGVEACLERDWDPKALMQNHEFLNPDSPFPTIYIPDRASNKVFIADYAFNEFASMPLVQRPTEWYAEERTEVEGSKSENKPSNNNKIETEEDELEEVECRLEDQQREEIDTDAQISMGKEAAEIDNSLRDQEESPSDRRTRDSDKRDGSSPSVGGTRTIPKTLAFEGQAQKKSEDHSPLPQTDGPTSPAATTNGIVPLGQNPSGLSPKTDDHPSIARNPEKPPCVAAPESAESPLTAPDVPVIRPILNADINLNPGASYTASIQGPVLRSVDWDAFD